MGVLNQVMTANGPGEVLAMMRYAYVSSRARKNMMKVAEPHWRYAYEALGNVSRSFALVIMQLEKDIRDPVCVFYLVLRAMDTVEDDTSKDADIRRDLCESFWKFLPIPLSDDNPGSFSRRPRSSGLACYAPSSRHENDSESRNQDSPNLESNQPLQDWSSTEFGSGAERELCKRFPEVMKCFGSLDSAYQHIIINTTREMGKGMADHILDKNCESIFDYDLYCHYVAGLVGYGLSDIFVQSQREPSFLANRKDLSNSMGLFLQKTNIIRDYLEDINDGRTFWPKEIWSQYSDHLEDFRDPSNRKFALALLNHMVTDALRHAPLCLEYMSVITSPDVFNFVAIPQVMAFATLAECYNNGKVFEGVVKLRRPQTAVLIQRATDMPSVYKIFFECTQKMLAAVVRRDPNAEATRIALNGILEMCVPHLPTAPNLIIPNMVSIVLFCGLSSYVLKRRQEHFDGAVFTWRSAGGIMEPRDMLAVGALFLVCMYMFAFFLLPYMTKAQQEELRRIQRERVLLGANVVRQEQCTPIVSIDDDDIAT